MHFGHDDFTGSYSCWALQVDPIELFARVQTHKKIQIPVTAFRQWSEYHGILQRVPEDIIALILDEHYASVYRRQLAEAKLRYLRRIGSRDAAIEQNHYYTECSNEFLDSFDGKVKEIKKCIRVSAPCSEMF